MDHAIRAILLILLSLMAGCSGSSSNSQNISSDQPAKTQLGGAIQGRALQLSGAVSTIAGVSSGAADGVGSAARFTRPFGIATDGSSLFVTDAVNCTVRRISIATGEVATLAGSAGSAGTVDGSGAAARFTSPRALTTDGTNLYVIDGSAIRKVAISSGAVSTLAGSVDVPGSADGAGATARFNNPLGISTDGSNLFVADTSNFTIRKVVIATGVVTTVAGTAGSPGSADGIGTVARFYYPAGLACDGANLFVGDLANSTIRRVVIATGDVSTIAGTAGISGAEDGTGAAARFRDPIGLATDGTNLYVAQQSNSTIRKVALASGTVTTVAGKSDDAGSADGIGPAAQFRGPTSLIANGGLLFVIDNGNCTVRKVEITTGAVTTFAGIATLGSDDGPGATARFQYPNDVTNDGAHLFVADTYNYTIRKVEIATGIVTTFAGAAGLYGSDDGASSAARFGYVKGITTDGASLFVTDCYSHTIRRIVLASGEVTTIAGSPGVAGSQDGVGTTARFRTPYGITTDGTNLFVADTGNNSVRRIVIATGEVSTLAGAAGTSGATDAVGAAARFNRPNGITTNGRSLFITDLGNSVVRRVDLATGAVTTLGETAVVATQRQAQIRMALSSKPTSSPTLTAYPVTPTTPISVTTDGTSLYITYPSMVRKMVLATGTVTTVAGTDANGASDGVGATARFGSPNGITTDGKSLYLTDNFNNTIRRIF